ncbi:MAG: hypothetical protein J5534_00925 [Fibrobacter sp.]|nr:hypothetical protein [Fibrobacter sp.]
MLKKIFVFSVMLASMAFAGNPYGYGSSEDANAAAGVLEQNKASAENQSVVNQTQYEDKKFALVFHPMSTIINGAQGVFTFYLNFEAGFGSFFSLITRPAYVNGTNNGVTASGFGIEEGFRFYVSGKGHKGWYVEPEVFFGSYDLSNSRVSATANNFGAAVVAGHKYVNGHFVFGFDAGFGVASASASSDDVNVDDFVQNSFGIAMDVYLGFAF